MARIGTLCVVLVCILLLGEHLQVALARGGRGGGSRGGGSRGRGGSRTKTTTRYKGGSKSRLPVRSTIVVASVLFLTRPRYRTYRTAPSYQSAYIYYDQSELDSSFKVNNNEFYTPFFLPTATDRVLDCLIVPKNISKPQCPTAFRKYVTNTTRFNFPSEFNATGPVRPKTDIALCCGTAALLPSIGALILTMFFVLRSMTE
uniref:Uncharacterized protein LOC108949415 n=1 Tax=Phallusia mammillata TaxID=59560 RepID=A0A6F9DIK3_9ASCI|nr:uncharacterized protein LOC108949415 [Phallusia mammillata]